MKDTDVRQLQVDSRKPMDAPGAVHPDACAKLTIRGVTWYVPPLGTETKVRFAPSFGAEKPVAVDVQVSERDEALAKLAARVRDLAPVRETEVCEKCGHALGAEIEISPDACGEWIGAIMEYVAALLRTQYDLSDAQLAELLAFDAPPIPPWLMQALNHALGSAESES